jgi:hypothetical protein
MHPGRSSQIIRCQFGKRAVRRRNCIGNDCEALRHEKFLFLAKTRPYNAVADPRVLLAEKIELLVSQASPELSKKSVGAVGVNEANRGARE